jgi:hypothetical protein
VSRAESKKIYVKGTTNPTEQTPSLADNVRLTRQQISAFYAIQKLVSGLPLEPHETSPHFKSRFSDYFEVEARL